MKALLTEYSIEHRHGWDTAFDHGRGARFPVEPLYDLTFSLMCDGEAAARFVEFMQHAFGVDVKMPARGAGNRVAESGAVPMLGGRAPGKER